jgi:filamentous hemagglutinin family protein
MNAGVFKLVFNKRLGMLVPIAEVLTPKHGGGTGRTRGATHGIRLRLARLAGMVGLALLSLGLPGGVPFVIAQTLITPDGRTLTVVGHTGAVWNVNTSTVSGSNAFNSFSTFNVGAGNTVNLHVPSAATNLINIVRDQRTDVYGILNAIKDGQIGGNVWFANPHGFVVGASGVVNVGSLTVTTPTQGFVDGFFTAPGSPNGTSVGQLLAGTAPRNSSGLISIQGRVNAIDGVKLDAGSVNLAGSVYSGARFTGTAADFSDVVNANGLVSATNVVVREGRIEIVADGDVSISGTLAAPGGSGVRGGDVAIRTGGNVDLQSGALIAARGNGDQSAGGTVNIRADRDAVARKGALVDASAGSSGDGGFIEFSAKNTVELAGGEFRADGTGGGKGGSVLIDPANIIVSADILRGAGGYSSLPAGAAASGANLALLADNEITVNDNVIVSTRSVAGATAADHTTGASTAASGNLTLEAGSISLKSGSKLLAGADSGFAGGDVTLKATRNWTGEARIAVDHATITGRNVALTASATYNDFVLTSWLPVVVPVTVATIDINAGTIAASGTLSLGATSLIKVSSSGLSPLGMITAVSASTVDVHGASALTAGGNTTLASSSTVTSKATPGGPNPATLPGDAGVATNVVVSTARTHVGDTSSVTVSGGTLDLTARNAVTATTTADSTAGGAVAIGGTLALSEVTSVTQAVIDGSATTSSAALTVGAEASSVVTTSAKAASKGAKKQTAAEKAAAPSETEKNLAKYKDQTTTSDGTVDVAAAVAIANVNNITLADMASTGTQASTGAATVSSKASSSSTVTADGSSASGSVGVGAAVGVNIGVLVNQARVAGNANVSSGGLTVSAVMPVTDAKNRFVTTATSGAGASSVGVAGALATNVLVNTNLATLEGGGAGLVNLNGGDLVVESRNTSESLATAGASVKPASATEPAAVGVGASVGINVAVNTTEAEIGDGAVFNGAKDVGLTAKGTHTLTTAATGGAAGADISVTPVAAITVAANTTTVRLGTGSLAALSGAFTGSAEQTSTATSTATGQTQGNNVAVGASIALNSATDTVLAEIDRNVSATGDVGVNSKSVARSGASATASVSGGEKATDTGAPPAKPDGAAGATVDEKVTAQGAAAKDAGKKTAEKAAAGSPTAAGLAAAAASSDADTRKAAQTAADKSPAAAGPAVAAASNDSKTKVEETKDAPTTEETTESGGVAVAAAVGVNVGIATTTASVGKGRTITSTNGALKVTSANETDTSAKADGSQVDPGNTSVGVGAAVALNAGISTNVAAVGDDAVVNTKGLSISAVNVTGQASDSRAEATSGAGAGDVGVAGSLAANVAINTTVAELAGDAASGGNGTGAVANANDGDILIEAGSKTTSAVASGAKVTGTGGTAKVGVGASIGVNVGVNTTVAEVGDKAVLAGGKDFGLNASADHALSTDVTGGAAGARVAVTPLVAATVAVNTTTARLSVAKVGDAGIAITGKYSSTADHTASATTTATGQTQGNSVAIGASIGLTVATDTVTASLERDMDATTGVELSARSVARSSTSATASVAGGEKADADDKPPAKPDGTAGKTVDQKVAGQQTKATDAGKATATKAPVAAATPAAGTSATAKLDETKAPPTTEEKDDNGQDKGGGVSVAAAVGVNAGIATTTASVAKGKKISSRNGALKVKSAAQLDAKAKADGSQVNGGNTDVGVGAAVALNLGVGTNVAVIGDNADVDSKGVEVQAVMAVTPAKGAVPEDKTSDFGADAKSGAGANNVGVAGALAVNTVVNTTVATIEGDKDSSGAGANVNATTAGGAGDVLVEAQSATKSTVASGADVKMEGDKATVGVGASVGLNVAVNTTVAEIADAAVLSGGNDLELNAKADHVMSTTVTGGAAGAKVAITPLAALSMSVNTTTARLGSGAALDLAGTYDSKAEQTSEVSTVATGQTQGSKVAVGASVGLSVAVDTVTASIERDVDADAGVTVEASSIARSSTSATASVAGGAKEGADGKPEVTTPASGGTPATTTQGKTADEQVKAQSDAGKGQGKAAATKAPATGAAAAAGAGGGATAKLDETKAPPTTEEKDDNGQDKGGGVSVAAAVGVNAGIATTTASVAKGKKISSRNGALKVKSAAQLDAKAKADGSQVNGGNTDVGVGAAVALNLGVGTNVAVIGDNADVDSKGVEVQAVMAVTPAKGAVPEDKTSDFGADAKSGAGANNVGVAGALAVNTVVNTTVATIEGDKDSSGAGANVNATTAGGAGDVLVEAQSATKSTVASGADVKMEGDKATVGVGASVGLNVAVNTTVAEIADAAVLSGGNDLELNAKADHVMSTTVTGGAAGAKVAITPVAAVSIAVNTTTARAGTSSTALSPGGELSVHADQTDKVTTKATGQAQGDVAVGASLAASVVVETVSASVERDVASSTAIDLGASSESSVRTAAVAGAKGAKAAKKDADGKETPEAGTTVDEQKKTQLDSAKKRNDATKTLDTDTRTPAAETPEVNKNDTTEVNKDQPPAKPPAANDKKQESKKVSVAAAIGVGVVVNQAKASIGGAGRSVTTTGKMGVKATTDTNYETTATGEAVSDNIGIAAAVALTGTFNKTQANIAAGTTVVQAGDIDVIATANQNRDPAFRFDMAAEAVSGASGGDVAVAGSLAVVGNYNETQASIEEGVTIGSGVAPVGDITVKADETSKLAARARAGALSTGKESKAGVGASFAAILSYNTTTAAAGYDTLWGGFYTPTWIYANSLTVAATKHKVDFVSPLDVIPKSISGVQTWVKNFDFDALDPLNYLGSNNYYTEAVAGAAAKGDAAVAGSFAVNLFMNTTEAYLGKNVHVTTSGSQAGTHPETLGVEVAAASDTRAIAFAGAVAGAKKAGVGISNTDIVNFDETNASIGGGSVVKAQAVDSGVKVTANAAQVVANVAVSAGIGTESTGVGGVLGIDLSMNKAEATIGEAAQVQAEGNVTVGASNDSVLVMIAGGVGGGKEVGVGAAVGINALWNRTLASIARDAVVDAKKNIAVTADADEVAVNAVVSGAGGGKAGVAASLAFNVILADTEASVGQGVKLNTSAGFGNAEKVAITARDDTVVVGVSGGGAGGGDAGVGAALDTDVVVKTVKAFIADDTVADGQVATIKADKEVSIDAAATETIVSIGAGFAGGGKAGVGGSVAIAVVANDVQAYAGKSSSIDSDGNVLIKAQDDTTAVLTAIAGAGGGTAGVGGSLAVATVVGGTRAYVGESAHVNARGLGDASSVYTGETGKVTEAARGLAVTAYNTENVVTTDVSGAGGGNAGVAVSLSGNVIANTAEAYIGRSAKINESNAAAGAEQQVLVKAVNETVLVNNAGGAGFGGTAGVGAAVNLAVIAKNTRAWIGNGALVNARRAVELDATSSEVAVGGTLGFAIGGSAGVGASLGGVGLGNTTEAYIEDAADSAGAAKVNVSAGDLRVEASDLATTTLLTGGGGGGGSAGVGGAIAVNVNASTTRARIGDYAETNASGTTAVHADSVENTNTVTVAGAGGGSAGVGGAASIKVVVSKTEAGIGEYAKVNQDAAYKAAGQDVDVKATDKIITVGVGGVGAGGGAAGVGGSADITVVLNTTTAYIGDNARVDAVRDVSVAASGEKYVNSATFAGAGGGAAGVAGGISIISVGSLLDGEAKSGLSPKDENGNATTTQKQADDLTTKSSVAYKDESGNTKSLLGDSAQSQETTAVLDSNAGKMAISSHVGRTAPIDFKNTQAFIGNGAEVKAGGKVTVSATDTTLAILAAGAGAGGGAAGVAGTLGVILLHDSAEAFIADNAKVDAGDTVAVNATTGENVFNVAVTGAGAGAAAVNGSIVVNVVSSDTAAYIGAAEINKNVAMDAAYTAQSVDVGAHSSSNLVAVAGAGNGAGAAAVGGVLNVNTLVKRTKAYIGRDADVAADENVKVSAESAQNVVAVGASFGGAGAAAVSGAADVNVVANVTEAFIGAARDDADKSTGARVDSDGNVSLAATDDSLVISASAVGNGAGAAAVGVNAGVNVISSQTRAYVAENSAVNARGKTAGTQVYSGTIADATAAQTPPAVPGGGSGDIDIDRDGVADGSVANGVTLNTKASSSTQSSVNPGAARDADGNPIAGAAGGLGSKGTETVKGLSVLAMGNEKVISATIGVAGAGAAAVTGAATANVISTVTEASIGDGAQINMSGAAGVDPSVRVRAADNTLMVQAGGTVTGAGAAAVSGTFNAGIVAKTTSARIGDADVKANDVEVRADSSEKVFTLTANVSIAGAAGVGAGIGVDVISNETSAGIGAGADIEATGDITVDASQNTLLNINTAAVAGGIAGVGGGFSVGVIANRTTAYVEGSDDLGDRTTLHAGGKTTVSAASEENLVTTTISGSGGVAGVTGAFGVKVLKSDTDAYIGRNSIVTAQDVDVSATDTTRIVGAGGAVTGGLVGVGGTLDATIVVNTTSAHIDSGASVTAVNDVTVEALSDKFVNSTTIAGSGGAVGVAGAVSIVSVGALLDGEAKSGLNGDDTGSLVDSRMKNDTVSGQLGSSEHVAGAKADVSGRIASQGVQNDLKGTVAPPLRNTMAFIGSGAQVKAGNNLSVAATDKTLAVITAGAGAGGAFAGVAGTLGVVLLHDAAEAYIADGAQADAGNALSVAAATQDNVSNIGITGSGAAGVAASGSIAVNAVSSETDAYIGNADINRHSVRNANQSVAVTAASSSNIVTVAGSGGVAGAASIGGVLNINALTKHTSAYIGSGADVAAGKEVEVRARSTENIVGAGVSIRGAGLGAASAVISANVADNTTEAYIDAAVVDADGNVKLSAVDDTLLVAVSAVGNGAGGTGVGQNVGANVVTNHTRAYVSGAAEIDARGSAAASDIYTGSLAAPTAGQKPPAVPGGGSGAVDIDRNGVAESDVQEGASFNIAGKEIDPGQARGADGNLIAAAQGGLGSKATESVKGLSVVAMNNEKMITATVGIAGAGGTAVTGASTADVIASVTEATIGDGAKINTGGATANSAVRVRAADNTVLVQTGATFAAAGAAGLSGSIDSGIVTKQTYARIGDADVNASSVEVSADSSEAVYNITVNAALAGGAGVGGAVGVDVIRNKTWASIGAGADIDASGNISVNATQDSAAEIYTVSGAGGIGIGVSGAVSVGVIANETKAYVEGSAGNAATLNAGGTTSVVADSSEKLTSVTISGAAGGLAGVAGAVGVKVVGSTTEAYIGNNTQVNQTRGGAAQDVVVSATDRVTLRGAGGTVALAGYAGVGATAEINIVRNTTTAYDRRFRRGGCGSRPERFRRVDQGRAVGSACRRRRPVGGDRRCAFGSQHRRKTGRRIAEGPARPGWRRQHRQFCRWPDLE